MGLGVAVLFGLAGLAMGLGLSARWSGAPAEALVPAGPPVLPRWPPGVPRVAGRQVWQGGQAESRSAACVGLAVRLAGAGPVLLLPDPDRREGVLAQVQQAPGVRWMVSPRPDADGIRGALDGLRSQGGAALIVDGASATADPDTTRSLLETLDVAMVVLLAAGAAVPGGIAPHPLSDEDLADLTL